jgi:glycosyl transferase family 87
LAKHSLGGVSLRKILVLFWVAAIIAVAAMAYTGPVGWDAQIYSQAVQNLRDGGDPYATGIAAQQAFHNRPARTPADHVPFAYVYSPMTLPLLRFLMVLPNWLLGALYGLAVAAGFFLELWAGFQMAEEHERPWLALMLPAVAFFPGLVTDDALLSGNVAYVLYGLMLAAAVPGWKRGRWFWFYVAVLAASIVKVPLLTLLAFPILVGKRQWVPASSTAVTGLLLFGAQARLWPAQFREYLVALRLVFDEVHDFGFGPAGVFGRTLWQMGRSFSFASTILYLVSTCTVGMIVLLLARRVRAQKITQETWIPVAFVATLLFYPRIMKYDLAALTIPMLLIAWRTLSSASRYSSPRIFEDGPSWLTRKVVTGVFCFGAANVITVAGPAYIPVELTAFLTIFLYGAWSIYQPQALRLEPSQLALESELPFPVEDVVPVMEAT